MQRFSYLKQSNADYIDELFRRYLQDADSVDPSWRYFFDGLDWGAQVGPRPNGAASKHEGQPDLGAEARVAELITAYRARGALLARLNPLEAPPDKHPLLELSYFQLSDADLAKPFAAGRLLGLGTVPLSEILSALRETYCGSIGVEFRHVQDRGEREWLQKRMESTRNREILDTETRKLILRRLTESECFERFLHTRYVAQKRFSIEGAESAIIGLDCLIEWGAENGARELVLGMAHRGRLNVLTNIYGKKPESIFSEFEGSYRADTSLGEGDVKYHMGYSADVKTRLGKAIHLSLASNPSHLEIVNPVIIGTARAKQDALGEGATRAVVPVLIHGDAAFAGQGVNYETLNLSRLPGYSVGGTVHLVINNQIGFTTNPGDSRSTMYATDLAKMLEAPVFHVNGDDPEAVWFAMKIGVEYRQAFGKDVFVDWVCYRRHGHNEGDEPAFTQPVLYRKIHAHPTTRALYTQRLIRERVITEVEAAAGVDACMRELGEAQARARADTVHPPVSAFAGAWSGLRKAKEEDFETEWDTRVPREKLRALSSGLNRLPDGFRLHSKLARFFAARVKAVEEGEGLDWGNGETLAYATLLAEGHTVRISGQDVQRGTFTHRHAVLHDFETGAPFTPLDSMRAGQANFQIFNSSLSEAGVLGFEYGYSLAEPRALVVWEAQFGDFANGAQIVIDQFISSGESKWQRSSGIALLLPHGYEGQGPEHSSARLERFLQLCGKQNIQVANLTTPAQIFHALRRQVKRPFRKPLVVMSPKSLLRHPKAVSRLSEFSDRGFQEVIPDRSPAARRILLCTGKVYYDLLAEKEAAKRDDLALVRVEQLYPWPATQLASALATFPAEAEIVWVQEEPRNMGAWTFVHGVWSGALDDFGARLAGGRPIGYVGREVGAAPAVGSSKVHEKDQKELVKRAIGGTP